MTIDTAGALELTPAEDSDESLAGRLRDGDLAAGEQLIGRFTTPLLRYLRRLTGNDHLAEELFQQAWLSVLEHIDRFDPSGNTGGFKAWVFRIATNKANDLWRSKGRERNAKAGLRLVTDEETEAAETKFEHVDEHHKLRHAIDRLPESQKQVVMMRYYSNMKFIEIAETLGCPLNTALGRMHKAVLKLREMMS